MKRLIGLPGDMWEERKGVVYINGKRLDEPYIPATRGADTKTLTREFRRGNLQPHPEGHVPDEGDNRAHSCDSRVWGLVPRGNIIGKVVLTYWPLGTNRHAIKREPRRSGALDQR